TTLELFDLTMDVGEGGEGDALLALSGERIDYPGTGAQGATFWVDPSSWTVVKAEAAYPWGALMVDQEYGLHEGRRLLERQKASVRPYGLALQVTYRGYRFGEGDQSQAP